MRHRRFCVGVLCASALVAVGSLLSADDAQADRRTQNVLLITLDGLRWQDLFGGADQTLLNKEFGGIQGEDALRRRFWRESAQERREAMMPFFWNVIAREGVVYGNPEYGSIATVTNPHHFSYPGYSEILTGFADPRIDSNDKTPNPNVTVLEWLNGRPGLEGRVRAFASWDVFPYIINAERSGIPVNAGWQPLDAEVPALAELNTVADELPHYWDSVRYDYFTFRGAQESIRRDQPRVLYVAFGETDDWAHAGRYDLYLDAARRTDAYIQRLWTTMQQMPAVCRQNVAGRHDRSRPGRHAGGVEIARRRDCRLRADLDGCAQPGRCSDDPARLVSQAVSSGGDGRCSAGRRLSRRRPPVRRAARRRGEGAATVTSHLHVRVAQTLLSVPGR